MIPVLYPPNTTDFSSFGLGVLTDTISCEVTEERNGVFECLLKYTVSGQHYGLITKECVIKAKPNDTAADQAFRIYRITKPLNGIVTIYGQHISYDLANVPVLPFSTDSRSPQLILSQLLAGDTRFTGWTDYSDAKAFSVTQPKSVRACLGGTEGSMLSKWYGEFEWDNFTVKFHSHRGQKTGVVIEYGKNLTAMEQDEDNSGVYTALLPYAVYTPEGTDTETVVTLPEVTLHIVTSEIVRAKTLIMDFSDQFDGVVTEDALPGVFQPLEEALLCHTDQVHVLVGHLPAGVCAGAVAMDAADVGAHVHADDIALLQYPWTGNAVDDLVVDGDAYAGGIAIVVQERGGRSMGADKVKHCLIDLVGCYAGFYHFPCQSTGSRGNFSRPAHQFDLVCGFQSDHASTPSARRIACVVPSTVDWSSTVFRIPRAS